MEVAPHLLPAYYVRLFDTLATGPYASNRRIFAKDREGRYFYANAPFARDAGLPTERLLGARDEATAWASAARVCREEDRQVLAAGRELHRLKSMRIGGRPRRVVCTKLPIFDAAHMAIGVFGVYYPLAVRKPSERATLERLERAHQIALSLLSNVQMACYEEQMEALDAERGETARQLEFFEPDPWGPDASS